MEDEIKYPDIVVELTGKSGNAAVIIGKVMRALKRNGVTKDHCTQFKNECMSGTYENVLLTCTKWVTIE